MTLQRGQEPNPALRLVYKWFFDHIQVEDEWVRQVRTLARSGRIVYVLRSLNAIDYLALDHVTKRFDLPRIVYVNDVGFGFGLFDSGMRSRSMVAAVRPWSRPPLREQLNT